jgi:AraC-like DNA-binding protein
MKRKSAILFLVILLFGNWPTCSAENPFLQFAGKPYALYHYALRDTLRKRHLTPTQACCDLTVKQLSAVPDVFHDGQWKIEAEFFDLDFSHRFLATVNDEKFEAGMLNLLEESKRWKNTIWVLRITRKLFDFYYDTGQSYDMALYARKIEIYCRKISEKEFPDVIDYKFKLAKVYFEYGEYGKAEKYFKEVVASPMMLPIQQIYVHARNDLGIIYRNYHHDLNTSDKWFKDILNFYKKYHITYIADAWKAVVIGNLGTNQMLRENYTQAIEMLSQAYEAKDNMKDYNYSFLMAYEIADCYCEMNKFVEAKTWLDRADYCLKHSAESVESTKTAQGIGNYCIVQNKYYTGIGDRERAYAFLDSAKIERQKEDQQFNTSPFFQVEQKESREELLQAQSKEHTLFIQFIIALIITLIIAVFSGIFVALYRKKQMAYKRLVESYRSLSDQMLKGQVGSISKTSMLSTEPEVEMEEETEDKETENDIPLIDRIQAYVSTSQCFLKNDITINSIAHELGVNRTALSNAINSTGSNFSTYLNQYRVSFAIKKLSSGEANTIEDVAIEAGFNNDRTMRNAFKAITGLSPSYFFKSN